MKLWSSLADVGVSTWVGLTIPCKCCKGVALTIARVTDTGFEAALIPFTLQVTNLGLRQAGQQVNLEFDVLAKYLERLMQAREGAS